MQLDLFAQSDEVGSGHAIQFDGVNDYIDVGNIYDDLHLPFTISAWMYLEPSTNFIFPVFVSQDNAPLYNGFWFCLSATNLFIEYGDGRGEQNDAYRKGRSAQMSSHQNRWIYVSAVFKSANDIQLYANGFNIGGAYTGLSNQPMASNYPGDVAKIGYFNTNSATHHFKGVMDELRIWNRSLTEEEIRETMCRRLKGDEPGLIGYWNFDETSGDVLKDLSPNKFNGTLKGNPTRVYSGAPVGDESVFLYTSVWSGKSLTKDDLFVGNVSGDPYGVHIYKVDHIPSQTGGMDVTTLLPPYYGIFLAGDDADNAVDFSFADNTVCLSFQRKDNSEPAWHESEIFSAHERVEIIPAFKVSDLSVDLGEDPILCDQQSHLLEALSDDTGKSFLWSTGETNSSISINASGTFWVEVKEGCQVEKDTILIVFQNTPPAFSLGEDEVLCRFEPRILGGNLEADDLDFTWQDGSKEKTLQVTDFGVYWLKAENGCGSAIDSIKFSRKELKDLFFPNFISPGNGDANNQFFILDPSLLGSEFSVYNRWEKKVYESLQYQNDWDGGKLPSGIYFYTIHGPCLEDRKGAVTIVR